MADHGMSAGADHPAMDYAEHDRTYRTFMLFAEVGTVAVLAIVAALAVGAAKGAWLMCIFGVTLAIVTAAVGVAARSIGWRAPAVPLVLMLAALALMPGVAH